MKRFFLFIITICYFNNLFAHAGNTHKYIVTKAYEVLRNYLGADISIMQTHLGGTDSYYDGEWSFQRHYITTGAYREDQEDLVYGYDGYLLEGLGLDFDDWVVSITHFWDADNSDSAQNSITATHALGHTYLGSFPNAYVKLKKYSNPDRSWSFKYKLTPGQNEFRLSNGNLIYITQCGGVGFEYNSLVELYTTGRAYIVGYYQCPNTEWVSCNYEVILGQGWRDAIVWEILGRMCHLLADMSVPAHAHVDEHGAYSDTYEDWMGDWSDSHHTITDTELSGLSVLNTYTLQSSDPLHFLMYTVQQITDHFYSDGEDYNGEGDNSLSGNGRTEEINWINNNYNLSNLGSPQTINEARTGYGKENLRNITYLLAARATAGLLYWFAKETNLIPIRVPQDYSTIATALAAAVSGKTISVEGNQVLNSNLSVPTGVTLTITSDATVNLVNQNNRYSIISTGGTINNQGTITGMRARLTANLTPRGYCGSIQTAVNYAQEVNEITLEDGNFNENVTISNKDILAIWGNSSQSYTQFGTLTVNNCYGLEAFGFGAKHMYVNNGEIALLYDLYATETNQSGAGLTLNYSEAVDVNNLYAEYLNTGIDSYSSEAEIEESIIVDNSYGIKSWNASNIDVDNTLFCGTATDLFAYNFSSIYATSCTYDNGVPTISSSGGSTVQSLYNQNCSNLLKSASENAYYDESINGDSAESEFREINKAYFLINKKFLDDKKNKTNGNKETYCADYEKVIEDFKEFIKNNPDSPLSKIALRTIVRSYRRIDNLLEQKDSGSMKDYLTEIINSKECPTLQQTAERLMIDYYRSAGDINTAITTVDKLIKKYEKDGDFICDVMYAKGLMLSHNMEKPTEAAECFSAVVNNYPGNPLVESAQNELRILGYETEEKKENRLTETNKNELSINNYPNPFNPSTTISYTLLQDGKVQIKIFDVLGREVATLMNGFESKGQHSVVWNGSSASSGIYFYTITFKNQTINKKMLLMK